MKDRATEAKEHNANQLFFTKICEDNFQNEVISHLTPGATIYLSKNGIATHFGTSALRNGWRDV